MQLSDLDRAANLVSLFLARADKSGPKPFLGTKISGQWHTQSWRHVAEQVCLMAESLRRLGLESGDRVLLVSENRPEWCIADLAIMAAGCITVPAYTTNTPGDHAHVLGDSGARAAIVSTRKLAEPLLEAIAQTGMAQHVITIETCADMALPAHQDRPSHQNGPALHKWACHEWESLLAGDAQAARDAVNKRIASISRDDTACIIYTSGTGGAPRGVMQHHGAILCNITGCAEIIFQDFSLGEEVFLSFLPLSHAYEHTAGQFLPIALGAQIFYAEGLEKLASNIEEARPTIMVVVPRLFEVLRNRIIKMVNKQGRLARFLMASALEIGRRRETDTLRLRDRPMDLLLERSLRPRIRQRFGGRIKALVSGGAPLNPDVGQFFAAMGLPVLQGYGQTEAGPVISCNRPRDGLKMDTVGPPLRGVEIKIAPDGEILCRGELVMHGYWQDPAQSAIALKDGWLHTGDIGHIDNAGRIVITDRKKDMIINDKGDNVAPQKLEGRLTMQPEIAQAMVSGDRRPYIVGLLVPDAEWALDWAYAQGEQFDIARLQKLPAFRSAIREAVDRVNRELSVTEKIRQFTFADEPFAIENKEMTPSLKIRRHKIRKRYGARLDALYKN